MIVSMTTFHLSIPLITRIVYVKTKSNLKVLFFSLVVFSMIIIKVCKTFHLSKVISKSYSFLTDNHKGVYSMSITKVRPQLYLVNYTYNPFEKENERFGNLQCSSKIHHIWKNLILLNCKLFKFIITDKHTYFVNCKLDNDICR